MECVVVNTQREDGCVDVHRVADGKPAQVPFGRVQLSLERAMIMLRTDAVEAPLVLPDGQWNCKACTFTNERGAEACAMCVGSNEEAWVYVNHSKL